ncbi:hypothetical protein [Methanoculleus sp. 10]|nr:hypothetical protein [Methanoculleus sp. 10]
MVLLLFVLLRQRSNRRSTYRIGMRYIVTGGAGFIGSISQSGWHATTTS